MNFGNTDRSDFLIPPFAFLYFYVVFAGAFGWPTFAHEDVMQSAVVQWFGVVLCVCGVTLMLISLISFGSSFRVGIDTEHPDALITTGIFAHTRNPIYVAFGFVLFGEFLIQPHIILLIYLVAGVALFHRQVMREEAFLRRAYGKQYDDYTKRVRRYL
jgi:protein-S-isoprenylcysteine O-methyltransferase Ste14